MSQAAPTGSQRLRALGWGEGHTKAFAILQEAAGADLIPAIVTDPGDGGCTAEGAAGTLRATYGPNLLGAMATDPLRRPLIDDWIAVRSWPDGRHTAEAILSRRVTLFQANGTANGRTKTGKSTDTKPASPTPTSAPTSTAQPQTDAQPASPTPEPAPRPASQPRAKTPAPPRAKRPPRRSESGPDF